MRPDADGGSHRTTEGQRAISSPCRNALTVQRLRHRGGWDARAYGEPWQFSVFYCVLSAIERVRLERDLAAVINHAEDQVFIIDLGQRDEAVRDTVVTLGPSLPEATSRVVVI